MAEGTTDFLAHKELAILRGEPFEYPSGGLRLHLAKNVPSQTGAYIPVSGLGYNYLALLPTSWGNAANREISNIVELEFPLPTGDWDTPIGVAIGDASNTWYFGTNEITKIINAGNPPYFDIGDLIISKAINKKFSSTWWANKRLNVLRGVAIAPPPFVRLILLAAPPSDADEVQKIVIPGFEFPLIPCDSTNWSVPANREIKNSRIIEFPKPLVDLPEVAGFAIEDDAENILWKAALTRNVIYRKDKLYISPGDLTIKA